MIKNIAFVLLSIVSLAAGPNWERINYRDSTVFSGIVTLDGKPVTAGDMVGAFVDQECRMTATVFKNNDSSYVSAVIHGEKPELVSFKLWLKAENKVYDLKEKVMSKPSDGIYLYHLDFKRK
jgi:hypothetical protein